MWAEPATADATLIPPEWHSWMCQTKDTPPSVSMSVDKKFFETPYTPNATATEDAYTPRDSIEDQPKRSSWSPNGPKVEPKVYPEHF